jgi:hypothetical protein
MADLDDHIKILKSEWAVLKEKFFHGEQVDPV